MTVPTGATTRVNVQFEDNGYNQDPSTSTPFVPGANAQLTTAEATNNGTRIWLPASNTAVDIKAGAFDGAWALQWALTSPWMFGAIKGAPTTVDNGDGTYTHTFDGEPDSFQIIEGYETSGKERTITGCVPARASIEPAVREATVTCTMEGFYATEGYATPASLTGQASLSEDTLDYGDAVLNLAGTAQAIMQRATLSLEWPNLGDIQGWGSRFPIDYVVGNFEPTIDYSKIKVDDAPLNDVYGGSTSMQEDVENAKTLGMAFDNGKTGAEMNQISFDGVGSFPESYNESTPGDVQSAIEENLNRLIRDVDVVATNGTATAP